MAKKKTNPSSSTMAALLKEKPKRGRPPRKVSRQNVYVSLTVEEKLTIKEISKQFPKGIVRADIPDLAVTILSTRMEAMRRAIADRDREMPEGVTDLESLFLLWDLALPTNVDTEKWTSIRLSPQPTIDLGRLQGTLNALFGATRSDTFRLGLSLLEQFALKIVPTLELDTWALDEAREKIRSIYL